MGVECPHDLHEREDMVQVDGYCPKCMLDTQERQTDRIWALEAAIRESVEYLDSNPLNSVGAGSQLHRQLRAALQGGDRHGS